MVAAPSSSTAQVNQLDAVLCPSNFSVLGRSALAICNSRLPRSGVETSWSIVSSPGAAGGGSDNRLSDIACSSASQLLGSRGRLPRRIIFSALEWSVVVEVLCPDNNPHLLSNRYLELTVFQTLTAGAVGDANDANDVDQALIEHWDGTSWTVVASPDSGGGRQAFRCRVHFDSELLGGGAQVLVKH